MAESHRVLEGVEQHGHCGIQVAFPKEHERDEVKKRIEVVDLAFVETVLGDLFEDVGSAAELSGLDEAEEKEVGCFVEDGP